LFVDNGPDTRDEFVETFGSEEPLGALVRRIVGPDRSTAKVALSEFLTEAQYTADQIRFVDLVIDHLVDNGLIDGDGYVDALGQDSDSDGQLDVFALDTFGDEQIDTEIADLDGDGQIDVYANDANADGFADIVATDTDADGRPDFVMGDTNADGTLDAVAMGDANASEFDVFAFRVDDLGDEKA
jgi:hypothetical protein